MAKEATRGQKQIHKENAETIKLFLYGSLACMSVYLLLTLVFFYDSFDWRIQLATLVAGIVYVVCIQTMNYMAKSTFDSRGTLIDAGIDLNMKEGFAEHLKDIIILTGLVQILSFISNYFWALWLFAPGRAGWLLWTNFISPWVFAPAPEVDEEREEKKQKKMERKMRRMN